MYKRQYKGGLNAVSSASSVRSNVIYLSAGTYYVNVFNLGLDRMDYGFINTFNGVGLASAGIYLAQYGGDTVVAGLVANKHAPKNLTYRWQVYSYETQSWYLLSDWNTSEWVNWQPGKTGAYLLYGEIKDLNGNTVQACIGYNHKEASITGICQMPNPYGPGLSLIHI